MTPEERKAFALSQAVALHAHRNFERLAGNPGDAVIESAKKFVHFLLPTN